MDLQDSREPQRGKSVEQPEQPADLPPMSTYRQAVSYILSHFPADQTEEVTARFIDALMIGWQGTLIGYGRRRYYLDSAAGRRRLVIGQSGDEWIRPKTWG